MCGRGASQHRGPADQPVPSAMIAWLIEAGEQFLIDTEVCAPLGQVGGWTTPSADSVPSGPARPMTTALPPTCNWPRLAWNTVTEVPPEVVTRYRAADPHGAGTRAGRGGLGGRMYGWSATPGCCSQRTNTAPPGPPSRCRTGRERRGWLSEVSCPAVSENWCRPIVERTRLPGGKWILAPLAAPASLPDVQLTVLSGRAAVLVIWGPYPRWPAPPTAARTCLRDRCRLARLSRAARAPQARSPRPARMTGGYFARGAPRRAAAARPSGVLRTPGEPGPWSPRLPT
jgi:hypothetical protein